MQPDLKEIVEQYGVMVSSIAHRMIQNKEIAKEAAQEVWYEIIKSIDSFNGESGLSTWIYTLCKRTILRYARNERIATMNELREFRELPAIDYNGQDRDEQEWIKACCLPYKQISEIMGITEESVRQISSRSIRKITHFMNDTCPLYNPQGTCKYRICKQVTSLNLEKEYTAIKKIIRLVDVYQRLEKELPRKNYWEKFIP